MFSFRSWEVIKSRKNTLILLFILIGIATTMHITCKANAVDEVDEVFAIKPTETLSVEVYLNDSSGVHGSFTIKNGTANFAFIDPDDIVIFYSDQVANGTINYSASKSGLYQMRFLNPSETQIILVEVKYRIKSWHSIAQWTVVLQTSLPWIDIISILCIVLFVMKFLSEILKNIVNKRIIIMKRFVNYESPKLPLRKH